MFIPITSGICLAITVYMSSLLDGLLYCLGK